MYFYIQFFLFLFYVLQTMSDWPALCIGYDSIVYIVIILTTAQLFDSVGAICPENHWWDQTHDSCAPCTTCEDQSIVLRPCQLHQDTLCGTLQDLEIDWSFLGEAQKRVVVPEWDEVGRNN